MPLDYSKFESEYLFRLLGGTPSEVPQVYKDRSPINHVDQIESPCIVLQGADDKVVPPEQSRAIVESLTARGIVNKYIEFEGEGHGFRNGKNIETAINSQLAFLQDVFSLV